jgi:preflagellin peptidase FlaK
VFASVPDLLRLVVVPIFAWAAYRDIQTRRVPNWVWLPLGIIGIVALAIDARTVLTAPEYYRPLFFLRIAVSLGLVAPLGYAFWRLGGFGGADAKAIMALALLFPTYPVLYLQWVSLPLERATLGVFSLTILTNTVLVGMIVPFVLAGRNAIDGRYTPTMFVGRPISVDEIPSVYGRLLRTDREERITDRGLDIDALRMYLRWRGTTLASVRSAPAAHRDPENIPSMTNNPGDGSLAESGELPPDSGDSMAVSVSCPRQADTISSVSLCKFEDSEFEDPWGAATFLADIDGNAYGTTPDQLRDGLEVLSSSESESVWVTPGIPFLVPVFLGLVIALTYGDVLFVVLRTVGVM